MKAEAHVWVVETLFNGKWVAQMAIEDFAKLIGTWNAEDATPATTNHPASVRERGENVRIELKTKYDRHIISRTHLSGSDDDCEHDALAAHAMQMAIEEAHAHGTNHFYYQWIIDRAAANLAWLIGDGNGSG